MVLSSEVEQVSKTSKAVAVLEAVGAYADVEKSKNSSKIRTGSGKMRNRRHVSRRGPLVVYGEDSGLTRAFRNLPGVDLAHVSRLNLLQLAPGGHLGRFVIFTESAFKQLDSIYGTSTMTSTQKVDYKLPRNIMTNSDLTRLINSDEVQSALAPKKEVTRVTRQKKNPLKNLGVMVKLNPYVLAMKRQALKAGEAQAAAKAAKAANAAKGLKPAGKSKAQVLAKKAHAAAKAKKYSTLVDEEFYSLEK